MFPLSIQSKITTYDVNKITPVFGFQYIFCLSVYQEPEYVIKNYKSYRSPGIESSFQLNNHTELLKTKYRKIFFLAEFVQLIFLIQQAWLKWLFFQFVLLSVYMQLSTHHWGLTSRSLRSICRSVCLCVHASVCVCMSLPNS